jgi:hypothetical protein
LRDKVNALYCFLFSQFVRVTMRDHVAAEMLHALAVVHCDEEPTLDLLLAGDPNLVSSAWLDHTGPSPSWGRILAGFTTAQLAWLAKSLVILERDLGWPGGADAASLCVFHAYEARQDADANNLADWIFRHRGGDSWVPFGVRAYVRSLEAYLRECSWQHWQYQARLEREKLERLRSAKKRHKTQERAQHRRDRGQERAARRLAFLDRLTAMESGDMLIFLATDRSFPLEAIPETLVGSSLHAAPGLPADVRIALLYRLDRRKARRWRSFRKALQSGTGGPGESRAGARAQQD